VRGQFEEMKETLSKRTAQSAKLLMVMLASSAALTISASAQDTSCLRRTVLVSVFDGEDIPAEDPSAENFRGTLHSQPVKILATRKLEKMPRVVVLLDVSSSMGMRSESWRIAVEAATEALVRAPDEKRVALVTFTDRVQRVFDFGERSIALRKLGEVDADKRPLLRAHGRSALYDTILEVLGYLRGDRRGDVIYVISDVADDRSRKGPQEAVRASLAAGVRLFGFLLPHQPATVRPPGADRPVPEFLDMIYDTGGDGVDVRLGYAVLRHGYSRRADNETPVRGITEHFHRLIANVYEMEIKLPHRLDRLQEWKLEFVPSKRVRAKDPHMIYPRKLAPCDAGAAGK
jgi:hypothetical protein